MGPNAALTINDPRSVVDTGSQTRAQNGSAGCNSGVHGGRKGRRMTGETASRRAVCHPGPVHQDRVAATLLNHLLATVGGYLRM